MNGFDMLKKRSASILKWDSTTAFSDRYAINAIRTSALDYLKPVDDDDLTVAIEKCKERND
jgi:YesN/AraC family two-component response regulator